MIWSWLTVTEPSVEPVELGFLKNRLRVSISDDDDEILDLAKAARQRFEQQTGRLLITQTVEARCDQFPVDVIELTRGPLQSVTWIKYYDSAGTQQTLSASNYQVDIYSDRPRITPGIGLAWPTIQSRKVNAVTIRGVYGYGSSGTNVPSAIREAIAFLTGHWYRNKEAYDPQQMHSMPQTWMDIAESYRLDDVAVAAYA